MMAFRINNLPKTLFTERDRDRQREKQRQERALMLPNDDKDISTSAQDLFHAPVKVDPSVEDRTTVEIRNTLGNFESVRHYVVDGVSGRSLIGVDQNSNQSAVHNSLRPSARPIQSSSSNCRNSSVPSNRNYPLASTGTTNLVNSSSISQNSSKALNPQKVPQSQNQLPHHSSQSGNNCTLSSANVSHVQLNSAKKSHVYNSAYTNSNSVSVDTGGIPASVSVDKNLNNNSVGNLSHDTFCAENPNDKNNRGISLKKPALERADSQLELESMLKEMMDVTAPVTAIQTPAKESLAKKYTPRRASKSEEKIVQSIREGMTNIPSPIKKMDSSESSSSDTESTDSEDSSSGSQGGAENPDYGISKPVATTNSPTRWNLSSFIRKDNIKGTPGPDSSGAAAAVKSPKDPNQRDNTLSSSTFDSEESPGDVPVKVEPSVTSTSIFGKSMSASPVDASMDVKFSSKSSSIPHDAHLEKIEAQYSKIPGKSPRKTPDVKVDIMIPVKPLAPSVPMKGPPSSVPKIASLSATSSEDEDKKSVEPSRPSRGEKNRLQKGTSIGKRKRPHRSSSSSERHLHKSDDDDSSPEAEKTKKVVQDRNKSDTIRKLFTSRKKEKIESPSVNIEGSKVNSSNSSNSNSRGKGSKPSTSNRVSAKDSGRKNNSQSAILVHNGDVDIKSSSKSSVSGTNPPGKKRENIVKDSKSSHSSSHHHSRKHSHKSHSQRNSGEGLTASNNVTNANPSITGGSRIKDEQSGKSHPSTLMCRIPLFKLPRPPGPPTTTTNSSSSTIKSEKDIDKSLGAASGPLGIIDSAHRGRPHYDSSRVGSSSDHASNNIYDPVMDSQRDESLCSDSERLSSKNHSSRKRSRKKPKSPKKNSKIKLEPDSHSKIDEDSSVVCGEVSSNVFGYTSCDSVSVSTTRTPPVEMDIVQAPDSSLNPPHLPSPVVPPQPVYFSYFERNETQHHEDYYSRDQDTYLEEAKRLKHKADNEKVSTTQASTYLEAGLYFILTGLSMERDRAVGSQSAFTMYKDTLSLIRYIGARFRSGRAEYSNAMEAKIIVLSMRCQALLSLKLFKIKMRETKDVVQYLTEHFAKAPPVEAAPIPNSPQLSTPSPHSPTSSPAGSSGILQGHTPSPHPHQNHHATTVPRSIYAQMYKQCISTMNLINAHELWESADNLVERYRMEEFFISIDRQYGPLTLHNSLVDLVRYVKHCLKVLKICSDIS